MRSGRETSREAKKRLQQGSPEVKHNNNKGGKAPCTPTVGGKTCSTRTSKKKESEWDKLFVNEEENERNENCMRSCLAIMERI